MRWAQDCPGAAVYRDRRGRLLAIGICDVCTQSISSVYFYFDPGHAHRSLGTFGALTEIQFAQARNIPYYYLGYFIDGCATMQYKADYRPNEFLCGDGVWRKNENVSSGNRS